VPPASTPTPTEADADADAETPSPAPQDDEDEHHRLLATGARKVEQGRFSEAIGDYRRAIALRSTAPANVELARAFQRAARSSEAVRALETAIHIDGSHAPAWLLLGEVNQAAGRSPQARAAYERFLELRPKGAQARAVRAILAGQLQ
jgi:tetratricopeptide (TPR) repeat protein